jgi:hypothetical protein
MLFLIHKCTLWTAYKFNENLQNSCVRCPETAKNLFLSFMFYEKGIKTTEIKQSDLTY